MTERAAISFSGIFTLLFSIACLLGSYSAVWIGLNSKHFWGWRGGWFLWFCGMLVGLGLAYAAIVSLTSAIFSFPGKFSHPASLDHRSENVRIEE